MSEQQGILLLRRSECASLMSLGEYIACIESTFKAHGEGKGLAGLAALRWVELQSFSCGENCHLRKKT